MLKYRGSKISMETGSWTYAERAESDRTEIEPISCETVDTLANRSEPQLLLQQNRVDKLYFKVSFGSEVKVITPGLKHN